MCLLEWEDSGVSKTGDVVHLQPIQNTVFAHSGMVERIVSVNPVRVRQALDSLAANRRIRERGMG